MATLKAMLFVFFIALSVTAHCFGDTGLGLDELSGSLKINVKALSPYLLKIDGGGSIGLRGDILKRVPDGTRIWIRGAIHSSLYDNRDDPTPAMMPIQWHIFMDVKEYKEISKPFEIPKGSAPHQTVLSKLKRIIDDLEPKVAVEYPEHPSSTMIVSYRPREFMVHRGTKIGKLSDEAFETTGPDYRGFILKVHIEELGTVHQAEVPQTVREPYWRTYLGMTVLGGANKQAYWTLSYGSKTDARLLKEIKQAMSELGKSQGRPGAEQP